MWPPSVVSVTPSASGEWEQENARLRLALREAQHRTGNQWQLLLGLAELESGQSPTSTMDSNVRLRVMLTAFASLNRALETDVETLTSHENVGVRAALENILALLKTNVVKGALHFEVQDAWLSEKGCAALLLSCAELVCNAIKYGNTTTLVTFRVWDGQGVLEVRDDGPGFPAEFCIKAQKGQGLQLVQALCRFDLRGEMRCHSDAQGAVVSLTFPVLRLPVATTEETGTAFCAMEGIICPDNIP